MSHDNHLLVTGRLQSSCSKYGQNRVLQLIRLSRLCQKQLGKWFYPRSSVYV